MARQQKRDDFDALFNKGLTNQPPAGAEAFSATVINGNGRVGKSSDPDYKKYTVVLRKQTHKAAKRLAEDLEPHQDLSDVVQELLHQWVVEQQAKAS